MNKQSKHTKNTNILAKPQQLGLRVCLFGFVSYSARRGLPVPAAGKIKQDKTRQDKTRQDKTRQDKTRQDKTKQDKTRAHQMRCSSTLGCSYSTLHWIVCLLVCLCLFVCLLVCLFLRLRGDARPQPPC